MKNFFTRTKILFLHDFLEESKTSIMAGGISGLLVVPITIIISLSITFFTEFPVDLFTGFGLFLFVLIISILPSSIVSLYGFIIGVIIFYFKKALIKLNINKIVQLIIIGFINFLFGGIIALPTWEDNISQNITFSIITGLSFSIMYFFLSAYYDSKNSFDTNDFMKINTKNEMNTPEDTSQIFDALYKNKSSK
jgi:hypothetical protein